MEYRKIDSKNGLRIISVPTKSTEAVTVLILAGVGSKYESKKENGISHFLEHMFFKGTKKRPDKLAIAETLDKIGGSYNAFTSKEYTGYWAKVGYEHLDLAIDWVSDIFLNSKIEEQEIQKEKGVIKEELNMYLDTPMQYIEDVWEELLYGDQPAGWRTIGTEENINSFRRNDFLEYMQKHYTSRNTVVCVAGNFEDKEIDGRVIEYFRDMSAQMPKGKITVKEKQEKPGVRAFYKKTDQTHLEIGVRSYNLFSKDRYALAIISTVLGGNMSSRLFMSVREENGLAYYIRTSSSLYTDSGYLSTNAGVPHNSIKKTVGLILKEYRDIKENSISPEELQKGKDYLKGSMALSLEPSDAKASFYGIQELLRGEILTPEQEYGNIEKVTREDIQRVAQDIFKPEKLNLALIGPHRDEDELRGILTI